MALNDGLQAFWKCNDNAADTEVLDYSGKGKNGVASTNTNAIDITGKINNAFTFAKSGSEYIEFGTIGAVQLTSNQDLTIIFWLYVPDQDAGGNTRIISQWGATGTTGFHIYHDIAKKIYAKMLGAHTSCEFTYTGTFEGAWHLVVVRFDRDGDLEISVDNRAQTETLDISAYKNLDLSSTDGVDIGNISATYDNAQRHIDCVAIWDRLLTNAEEEDLWNDGDGTEDFGITDGGSIKPTDRTYTKQLISIAGNELWYEDDDHIKTKLAAAAVAGELDCTKPLDMFELDGKVFIVNGTRKKIYDPTNVKLSTADLGPNPPDHGNIITGDDSGAEMVVDYITNLDDDEACLIYGQKITTADFRNTERISGYDDDGNEIDFVLDAAQINPPHWYNWTTYGNAAGDDATFGELPDKATMGCNYMGRATISGNDQLPHQWYMMRSGNPFDALYGGDDALSAVAGNNADAGEIGDTVRAVIPYKDDYLIYGCVNTMWYLIGNPCSGGEIVELDLTTGMYGPKAWCFDSDGNFYFWGTNGLYRCKLPEKPICISEIKLPRLVKDEDIDPTTHRITLHYDRLHAGIIVAITKISDGTNSNYWYDLRALDKAGIGGFFPEEYAEECAIFSGHYYEAQDPDYRGLVLGCNDGYLRFFDDSAKNDVLHDSTEEIDAYVTFGPIAMSDNPKQTGKLIGLDCVLAGGAINGNQSDSNNITYDVWVANSAAEILEKIFADTSPKIAGTFKAPGRRKGSIIRKKIKGMYIGIKLQNNTTAETWAFERLMADFRPSGRLK